jgi:hypothetical protein
MSGKNTAGFGVDPPLESAETAVDTSRTKGFRSTDISVLFPQNGGSKSARPGRTTAIQTVRSLEARTAPSAVWPRSHRRA